MIKVVHCVIVPVNGKCGLYGTARDLVKAERMAGLDAQVLNCDLSDPTKYNHEVRTDNWLTSITLEEAKTADIFVVHSGIPKVLERLHKPIVVCVHGRPESTFLTSRDTPNKIHHLYATQIANPDYKAFVSFWKEYAFAFGLDYPKNKLWFVNSPCDTDEFIPEGPKYDFGVHGGKPNIVIADIWRDDVTPFNAVMATVEFLKTYAPDGRLHIFGLEKLHHGATTKLLTNLIKTGVIGVVSGLVSNIADVFRAADFVVTPHVIDTRIVREAMSCGCPVIKCLGRNHLDTHSFSEYINNVKDSTNRNETRECAVKRFNLKTVGEQMRGIFETLYYVAIPSFLGKEIKPYGEESIWDKHGRIFGNKNNWGKVTICETNRRLHDLLILSGNKELIAQLDPLLEQAYKQGIAMQNQLVKYNLDQIPIPETTDCTQTALNIRTKRQELEELLKRGESCV